LTPLGCALGGAEGRWRKFSSATTKDWEKVAEILRGQGAEE
jgi:hypothetical protein